MGLFILGLVVSGVTAFPLLHEMRAAADLLDADAGGGGAVGERVRLVRDGLEATHAAYPWIAYGTDWLGFGHLVIAMFFVRPWFRPAEARSPIGVGLVACAAVPLVAWVAGEARGIPVGWRLLDGAFGVVGAVPLIYCLRSLRRLERAESSGEAANRTR